MVSHPREVLASMRPHQWVKNVFVLAPLVFAERALVTEDFLLAAAAFLLFSALSGAVYILNDIVDVAGDRSHPTKRHRPIASGRLSLPAARMSLAVVLIGSVGASFAVSPAFAAVGLSYFALNVGYSFALKHTPFVDVACIAGGFLLRLVGGAVAIDVPPTPWILACTFLIATFLGLGKRKHELLQAGSRATAQRRVLARYRLPHVRAAMVTFGALTLATYAAYTIVGAHVGQLFDPRDLVWTIPNVALGLWRFQRLTDRGGDGESPTDRMLSDPLFLVNIGVYVLIVVLVIYVL